MLCESILEDIARRNGLPQREVSPDALALMRRCRWPGNVRELRNVLEQASMLTDATRLTAADIAGLVTPTEPEPPALALECNFKEAVAGFERRLIHDTLAATDGKVPDAARRLGIGRATLYKKMAALGLTARESVESTK